MAAVLVQIRGTLYDLTARTSQQVLLQGEASVMGLGVGGGPVYPPDGGGGGGPPDHIWGPTDPRPSPPIANVPGAPGYQPPVPAHPIYMPGPHPEHPIVIPPQPTEPPQPPTEGKPPPPDGGWGWHPEYGWGYFPGTGGTAGPKA